MGKYVPMLNTRKQTKEETRAQLVMLCLAIFSFYMAKQYSAPNGYYYFYNILFFLSSGALVISFLYWVYLIKDSHIKIAAKFLVAPYKAARIIKNSFKE